MKTANNRAFKEWAVACQAMQSGEQILIIRKGGIREEGGVFTMSDPEFFLMPTYEHQKEDLLQQPYAALLREHADERRDPSTVTLSAYAVADTILTVPAEEPVLAASSEYIWNERYVRMRFDFNPYDPLYVVLVRVYRLAEPVTIPMLPDYIGCKSWVSLDREISTAGSVPAVDGETFAQRRAAVLAVLGQPA